MNNLKILVAIATLAPFTLMAQDRFATRTGHITFTSDTPAELIVGDNHKVTSVMDAASGAIQFEVLIKAFEFKKALMQEHFNENYMESNTFPKASFKGNMTGATAEQLKKAGTYEVMVEGDLTIHGVTKPVKVKGTLTVDSAGGIKASSDFVIVP